MSAAAAVTSRAAAPSAPASFADAQKARAAELLARDLQTLIDQHQHAEALRAEMLAAQSRYNAAALATRKSAQNITPRLDGRRRVLGEFLLTPLPDNATLHIEKIEVL